MDNVRNRCLFSVPSKVEMAEEQEYLRYHVWISVDKAMTKNGTREVI